MIFLGNNHTENFEEEEEEEKGIDDSLISELGDEILDDDEILEAEIDPLLKAHVIDPLALEDEDEPIKAGTKVFENDEEDEEVDDYDSFDDRDEM